MDNKKNLENIRRIDQFAKEVIEHCNHAALFEFSISESKWLKTETDGPLFIYKRLDQPLYSLMIANRQSLQDFIEPITEGLNLKYEPPYIFIHRDDGQIRGVWVYGEDDCKRVFNTMLLLRDSLKQKPSLTGMTTSPPRLPMQKQKPQQQNKSTAVNENIQAVKENMTNELMKEVIDMAAMNEPKTLRGQQRQQEKQQQPFQQQRQTPITTKEPNKTAVREIDGHISQEPVMTLKENIATTLAKKTPEKVVVREKEVESRVIMSVASATTTLVESESTSRAVDQVPQNLSSPSPYQHSGALLRPVTFGDLERLKQDLMEGFRHEMEKLRMDLSGPKSFDQH